MKQFCQYHPTRAAHWTCDGCGRLFCPQCVTVRDRGGYQQGQKLHMCPSCNREVQWLGIGNVIDPFWKRMHRFFLYPMTLHTLALMIGLSIIATLFPGTGILGLLTQVLVWGIALKYAYTILQTTASGNLTVPPLNAGTLIDNFGPVAKQGGIYVALFVAGAFVFTHLGVAPGLIFVLAATLFLPAMIILLVTTGSLIQAINPVMFATLAFRIGWGYLLMYFFHSLLGGAPALLGRHVIQHFPPLLQVFLFTLVQIYYTFVSYHLMGYVILQYHAQIGYQVDADDFMDEETLARTASQSAETMESRLLLRVNQMIKDGDHAGAMAFIENETGQARITDPLLSERYYSLLKLTGAADKLAIHGKHHLALLVRQDNREAALTVYRECLAAHPDVTPSPAALFKIGSWLNESGDGKGAIGAFSRLTKVHPQDPLVPKSYFRAAQIFNDHLMNPKKARSILNGLKKKFPGHDIIPFVERYMADMV